MSRSELVSQTHLQRKALIYIRQSTPHQVLSNQESLRLEYALQQRAVDLGWRAQDIEIIDADLGMTGASASHRVGFQELVTRVTLGQVGMILSVDVTRLSRNCSDWYPLLDVCGYRGCLIADRDGIYDPGSANGRLLLGLKGQLSELELHTIRARMTAGLLNKAQRGELALSLPIGLVRNAIGKVHKDPNRAVQDRLDLIFATFLRVRSASKVLQFLNAHDLRLPRRDRFGAVVWKKPTVADILQFLKNPAYAGSFTVGNVDTKWWFSTKVELAISVTICGSNIMSLSANTFTLIPLICRLWRPFSKPFRQWNSMSTLPQSRHSKPQPNRLPMLISNTWSICAMKPL